MNGNPILEEAGYDVDRFVDKLRDWTSKHPPTGPVVHNAEELRQLVAEQQRQHAARAALALNEKPPKPAMPE